MIASSGTSRGCDEMTSSSSEMLEAALRYAGLGWRVHPLHHPAVAGDGPVCSCRDGVKCDHPGKHPRLGGWTVEATTDEATIRGWWGDHPSANVGIAAGSGSGLFLLDIDGEGAKARIAAYVEKNGITTAAEDLTTTTAKTGKGSHLIFGWVDGVGLENFKNTVRLTDDLDIKTEGGQFVAPPSLHPSGVRYEWIRSPWEVPPRPVPAWLADFLREEEARTKAAKRTAKLERIASDANKQKAARLRDDGAPHPYGLAALEGEVSELRATSEGERNDRLNKAAFSLFGLCKGGVLDKAEVERELSRAARSVGLDDSEISKTLASAWSGAVVREVPDDGRREGSPEEARDYLETVRDGLKADPRKLKDRAVLAALLTLRKNDPIEFDLLAAELKAAAGWVKLPTLKKMIDREERRQADEKRARADEEGAGDGGGKGDDPGYYGFARHDFGDYDDEGKFQFSRATAAASIPTKTPMAMGAGGKDIFYFDGQIYRPQGGPLIGSVLYNVCDDGVNKNQVSEVLDRIRADLQLAPVTWNPDPCLMPLQNGVLDLRGGAFRGYQAEDRFTFQYNAKWNAEGGDWRRFIWFLCTALPDPRDVLTAIDIMTAVALRIPFDVIVQLLGGGSNGKGVFEKVLLALFTAERSTALDLEELKRSRFGAGALFDVDLWIISEVEGVKDAISALKKIATGEFTDSDTKYGGRRKGRPHAVPILDSNNAFDFGDESYGRRRRMARLDFCYTFGDGPEMRPIDRQMEESLTTPDSLAGLVQIIAARAPGLLRDRKIYNRKTTEEAAEEYRRQQYSLGYFCDECLSAKGGEREETTTIYGAYLEYCKLFKVPTPASHISLGRYISKVFGVQSVGTSEGSGDARRDYRYYPGVHLAKPPQEAHADHLLNHPSYSSDRYPTDIRQKGGYEISICNYIPTDTTDKTLIRVLEEICRIYGFISSCEDERDITWESYHQKSVGSVVSVGDGHCITVSYPTGENQVVLSVGEPVGTPGEDDVAGQVDPPHKPIDETRGEVDGEDRQTIAEELEEADRREAEYLEHAKTPEPKGEGDLSGRSATKKGADPPEEETEGDGREPAPEEGEALEVARSLQAAGKRVTFGNVEAHLNKAEGYVETSRVWGILRALGALGWTTDKEGALSEGVAA